MRQLVLIGFVFSFLSCKSELSIYSTNPREVVIACCELANAGIKGDTAKYNLYRNAFLQDSLTQTAIFGAILIYGTAKMTQKGTIAHYKNLEEVIVKNDTLNRKTEVIEKVIFTFENNSTDTVSIRLVQIKNRWLLKWQGLKRK
jgi:hypothetical protein